MPPAPNLFDTSRESISTVCIRGARHEVISFTSIARLSSSIPRSLGANPLPISVTAISCAFSGSSAVYSPTKGRNNHLEKVFFFGERIGCRSATRKEVRVSRRVRTCVFQRWSLACRQQPLRWIKAQPSKL